MAVFKCKMCGGVLEITGEESVCECEYCGTKQTVPIADNEKKMTLFARANRLRTACEFDKAAGVYESIVSEFPEEAEAYWGLVLCKFGIEYVDDPATGKKIPTCHRSSFDSIMDDSDFEQTLENADSVARKVYREEAKAIEEIRKGILEVSSKEEPFDIFICYKETAEDGDRTVDSVIAQNIYDMLTENEYKVFFARVTLEDKLGTAYEPYIFAALNSAKIMLAIGTDYEYYNAVWVKNEWSRYLALITKGEKKTLIPCYKDLDAYDIPKEFKHLQAQDMGKVGAMQDLLRGIKKILPKNNEPAVTAAAPAAFVPTTTSGGATIDSLLKRVYIFLEDGDFKNANTYCEKVLDIDPENVGAYLGKLMVEYKVNKQSDLCNCINPLNESNNLKKIIKYGDDAIISIVNGYDSFIIERNRKNQLEVDYSTAVKLFEGETPTAQDFQRAQHLFELTSGYKNSDKYYRQCEIEIPKLKLYEEYLFTYHNLTEVKKISEDNLYSIKNAVEVLSEIIEKLKTLGDYRDCTQKIEEYSEVLHRLKNHILFWKDKVLSQRKGFIHEFKDRAVSGDEMTRRYLIDELKKKYFLPELPENQEEKLSDIVYNIFLSTYELLTEQEIATHKNCSEFSDKRIKYVINQLVHDRRVIKIEKSGLTYYVLSDMVNIYENPKEINYLSRF